MVRLTGSKRWGLGFLEGCVSAARVTSGNEGMHTAAARSRRRESRRDEGALAGMGLVVSLTRAR
jgi:hypothetical protein